MFERIFNWLEGRTDTFPPVKPEKPGNTLWGFVWHYTKPFWPMILVCSALASAVALIEVSLFSFLGNLIDWLSTANRETFWQDHRARLITMMGPSNASFDSGNTSTARFPCSRASSQRPRPA